MQAVRGSKVAGPETRCAHRCRILRYLPDLATFDPDPGILGRCRERRMQHRAAHAAAGAVAEPGLGGPAAVEVPDAVKGTPVGVRAEPLQLTDRMRHEPLAAGLVDRAATMLHDDHLKTGSRRMHRGGQPGRTASRDE